MIIRIFTNTPNFKFIDKINEGDLVIATDAIAYHLLKMNYKVDVAIGDFDSIDQNGLEFIKINCHNVIELNPIKDNTDTKEALEYAKTLNYSKIIIYTNTNGRIDHFYNMFLLLDDNIVIKDHINEISLIKPGKHDINHNYKYISFYAKKNIKALTLKGFKYELDNFTLNENDTLCVSNEGSGTINFKDGELLIFKSNE